MKPRLAKLERGYTLLELAVATVILGIVVVTAVSLFFSSIRGGGRVEVGSLVKQNGEFALNVMEQLIRNSRGIVSCSSSEISLTAADGENLIFSYDADGGYLASNGARLTSAETVVSSCAFSCDEDETDVRPPIVSVDFSIRQA
jgi:prepilin-type N-terminal cleavage/methylation domain-containing protein